MQFARHETFQFREGWLTKGLRKIETEGIADVFLSKEAIEELGIGNNMVKSLRYWMQATNLTKECKSSKKTQKLTPFGKLVYDYDRYFEDELTLWLVHYHLTKNDTLASTWYWFFNIFEYKEFDEEIFIIQLEKWVKENGGEVARGSLKRDFDCFISTYVSNRRSRTTNPEDNIVCPLQELNLIEAIDTKEKRYRITRRNILEIPKEVFLYSLLDFAMSENGDQHKHISIDDLFTKEKSMGRIYSLGLGELIQALEVLQAEGYIYMTKTAGLNNVTIHTELCAEAAIIKYFEQHCEDVSV